MKVLVLSVVVSLGLLACATPISQREANKAQIQAIKNVDLVYPEKDSYFVYTSNLGTNTSSVSGVFGAVGVLVGAAVDIATTVGGAVQSNNREDEFTKKIHEQHSADFMTAKVAKGLKSELTKKGYVVGMRPITLDKYSIKFEDFVDKVPMNEKNPMLVFKVMSGYSAAGLTDPFKPATVVHYSLYGVNKTPLYTKQFYRQESDAPTYKNYSELSKDHQAAFSALQKQLEPMANVVYKQVFEYADTPKKEVAK